jgi:voltage-gated potassium channel
MLSAEDTGSPCAEPDAQVNKEVRGQPATASEGDGARPVAAGHLGETRPATTPDPVRLLSPAQRRRLIAFALLRSLLVVVALVTVYFTIPLTRMSRPAAVAGLIAGLLIVAGLLGYQIRATARSSHPGLRAVESLGASAPLLILLFAVTHYLVDLTHPGSYSEAMTRLDALYFSVTMFTTVGFGDITPVSEPARVLAVIQMLASLIFLGVVARVLFGAALSVPRSRTGDDHHG